MKETKTKPKKKKANKKAYYVSPKHFLGLLTEYYSTDDLVDELAESVYKIAVGLSYSPNFINKKSYKIIEVAKLFKSKIKFLPARPVERYASALTDMNLSNKVYKHFGKIRLEDYIKEITKK